MSTFGVSPAMPAAVNEGVVFAQVELAAVLLDHHRLKERPGEPLGHPAPGQLRASLAMCFSAAVLIRRNPAPTARTGYGSVGPVADSD